MSRRAPAGVSVTPVRLRSNSRRPAVASSAATCRETADCVYPSDWAAAENDPASATSRRIRSPVGEKSEVMRLTHTTCVVILVCDMATASYGEPMTHSRIALVTGANQGLGRALVEGLAAGLSPSDRVC